MNQQPEDLRSCPFCLGLATLEKIEDGCYGVGCTDCDFQLMNGSVGIGWHESEQEAIAAWNERGGDLAMSQLRAWVKDLQDENTALKAAAQSKCLHQIQEPAATEQAAWHAGLDEGRAQAAPAAVAVPDERKAFEIAIRAEPIALVTDSDGDYENLTVQLQWEACLARAALAATPAAAPVVLPEPAAFETWAKSEGGDFARHNCGPYDREAMTLAGMAWQRALLAQAATAAGLPALAVEDTAALEQIADIFLIGADARKSRPVVVANVSNAFRRSKCLSLIEALYFTVQRSPVDQDDEDEGGEECLLNWGQEPEQYAAQFGEVLKRIAPQAQADAREFPAMTPELASILGLMCFECIPFAQALRIAGHQIKTRAEDEQAAVLHWMLGHWFRHGEEWRDHAQADMNRMKDAAIAATKGE